jgi:hypothetical protein
MWFDFSDTALPYFRSLGIGHVDVVAEVVCLYGHVFA